MKFFTQTSMEGMDLLFIAGTLNSCEVLRILPQLFNAKWVGFEKGFGYAPGILDL